MYVVKHKLLFSYVSDQETRAQDVSFFRLKYNEIHVS